MGIDPASDMLAAATLLDREAGTRVEYQQGTAEDTGLAANTVDVVSAGQCWHWFDPKTATTEIQRILKPGSILIIAYFDWLHAADVPTLILSCDKALV